MNPITIVVENLVFTCIASYELNLQEIAVHSEGKIGYNPKKFAAATLKFYNPNIAILMFENGKMVCTGAKVKEQAEIAIEYTKELLIKIGYKGLTVTPFVNHNIVCKALIGFPINCALLAAERSGECSYEPSHFPGVVMRHVPICPVTVLIFESGKMVLTGAKNEKEAIEKFDLVYDIVKKYIIANKSMQESIIIPNVRNVSLVPNKGDTKKRKTEVVELSEEFVKAAVETLSVKKKKNGVTERKHISEKVPTSSTFIECEICGLMCYRKGKKDKKCCLCNNELGEKKSELCSTCRKQHMWDKGRANDSLIAFEEKKV